MAFKSDCEEVPEREQRGFILQVRKFHSKNFILNNIEFIKVYFLLNKLKNPKASEKGGIKSTTENIFTFWTWRVINAKNICDCVYDCVCVCACMWAHVHMYKQLVQYVYLEHINATSSYTFYFLFLQSNKVPVVQHPHHVHPLTPLITYSNEHFTPGNPPPHLQADVDPKTGRLQDLLQRDVWEDTRH